MLPEIAASAQKIGVGLSLRNSNFLKSMDAVASNTAKAAERSKDRISNVKASITNISTTQKKIEKSKSVQEEILERQQNFLKKSQSSTAYAGRFKNILKSMIKKPVEVLQKILLGLIIAMAPLIIARVKKLINQFKLLKFQATEYLGLISNIVSNSVSVLQAILDNALNFDFTDKNKRLDAALSEFQKDFDSDQESIKALSDAWSLNEKELELAIKRLEAGEDPTSAVKPQTSAFGSQSGSGGATVRGTAEEYRIAAAVATEAGRGVSATDVLQVAANRVADPRYPDNFTDVFAQPGQFQGVFDRGIGNYRNISDAQSAAAFSGRSVDQIQGYVADLRSSDLRSNSASEIGGALEFRAAPSYYQERPSERPSGTGSDGRIPGSSWRGGSGDNQILRDPSQDPMRAGGAAPISYSQGGTTSPSTGASISPTGNTTNSTVLGKGDMVSGYTVTSPFGMRDHPVYGGQRNHGGLDIGTPTGTYLAFNVGVEILYAGSSGGYGYVIDAWAPSLGLQFRCAHLSSIKCRVGQKIPAGQCVGRTGGEKGAAGSGTSTGPHLHFEVDTRKGGSGYGGSNDPKLLAQASNYLILSRNEPSKSSTKLNASDLGISDKSQARLQGLDYDYDAAERLENQSSNLMIITQPILAKQNTVINRVTRSETQVISGGGGKSTSSSKRYNEMLMTNLS